ncbi:hypothetical protein FACS189465_1210 [Clostridia bacterium]|nr:hypothetical protein FACS189465_1210 [Clostridia bacterium]
MDKIKMDILENKALNSGKNIHALEKLEKIKKMQYPYNMEIMGIKIQVNENVYPTSSGLAELYIETLEKTEKNLSNKKILDYGTGTGFLAIKSSLMGANVTGLDINPHAIKCAEYNAAQNNTVVDFRESDCLQAIKNDEKFDMVLAGMPWDNTNAENYIEMSLFDTNANMKTTLFSNADKLLTENGYILMGYSDFMIEKQPIKTFIDSKIAYEVINKKYIKNSEHFMIKLWYK